MLTVKQPWAWLIINGEKLVENRTWQVRYRGPLLIHVSKSRSDMNKKALAAAANMRGADWSGDELAEMEKQRGQVVGLVQVENITRSSQSSFALPGQYHWELRSPKKIVPPFSAVGKATLWYLR